MPTEAAVVGAVRGQPAHGAPGYRVIWCGLGLVRVEQGRGSFVADEVIDYPVTGRTRFNEWIRKQNGNRRARCCMCGRRRRRQRWRPGWGSSGAAWWW